MTESQMLLRICHPVQEVVAVRPLQLSMRERRLQGSIKGEEVPCRVTPSLRHCCEPNEPAPPQQTLQPSPGRTSDQCRTLRTLKLQFVTRTGFRDHGLRPDRHHRNWVAGTRKTSFDCRYSRNREVTGSCPTV